MIKEIIAPFIIGILLSGCGEVTESEIDVDMQNIDGLNPNIAINEDGLEGDIFGGYLVPGLWVQYEYDDNDEPKYNELGIDFKYMFEYNNTVAMNISIIDQWIPLGKYEVDSSQTLLTFEEGSPTSLKQFEIVEQREGSCLKVAKYSIDENNSVELDDYYHLCKQY